MNAKRLCVLGQVQGVGFRPFVYRLAMAHDLAGWVQNGSDGVSIHVEGTPDDLEGFERALRSEAPSAARIDDVLVSEDEPAGSTVFEIRESARDRRPKAHLSPDLPVCHECLTELFDARDRRAGYPYINCAQCGPRFSLIQALPYDRERTTMTAWTMCPECAREFGDPADRRFHAQPIACPRCGPGFHLWRGRRDRIASGAPALDEAARRLREGGIVAVKGIGGYHLACDARCERAVAALRTSKARLEMPFAVMAKDLATARAIVALSADAERLLLSPARPIVIATAKREYPGVAPGQPDLGVMLPYTPVHHVLFVAGAPDVLVMTSGNRVGDPLVFGDDEAFERLDGLAETLLVGERPIARRVDDSIARDTPFGHVFLRRGRGLAPAVAARFPASPPLLAVGADLKNTITLVVDGDAFVSQHHGDLEHYPALEGFWASVRDFLSMYDVDVARLVVVHDKHPHYASTAFALAHPASRRHAVQHHHAHVAGVLAERAELERRVLGVVFDGTGYGDDGMIWGGEFLFGSVIEGFRRVGHLRPGLLPGGDAAARFPAQAAAGFLAELDELPDLTAPPFDLPPRYRQAERLVAAGVHTFSTTSVGRLFDVAAALLGFTRAVTYEGQAAVWLEHLASTTVDGDVLPFDFRAGQLDFRAALRGIVHRRVAGEDPAAIAMGFHRGLAVGIASAVREIRQAHPFEAVVLSGGVFQNVLLLSLLKRELEPFSAPVWTHRTVPPNDGGISLGQAALAYGLERSRSTGALQ